MNTNSALNDKLYKSGRTYMLRKIRVLDAAISIIDDLLCSEIKDEQDRARVNSYRRGLNKAIRTLRYS